MKEILEKMKNKYLSFDKSKSNKNFIFNQKNLIINNSINDKNNLNEYFNINTVNSNYYLTERNSTNNSFKKKTRNKKFKEMYNISMKKIFEKRINNKLPDLKNINYSRNLIIQKIRRHVLFTGDDYPYSLNDNEYGYKTLRFREKKDILKEKKCILEQIDNEEYMSKIKSIFNEELINKEKISFLHKDEYANIIYLMNEKINIYKFENNTCLLKKFYVKRDYKTYLAGRLSINSILIKIVDINNNLQKDFFLPFILIPFYFSIPRNIFYYFISKILSINKNEENNDFNYNDINIDERKIEKNLKLISTNYKLFDNNSILFEAKKLEKEIFYLFINDKTYTITIIPPYIELSKNEEKIKIKKIVSKGLCMTLFQKDYKNWDLLSLIYLYSFHDFRQIQYSTIKFHSKQIIDLNLDEKNSNVCYIPTIKEIDKYISFYIYNNSRIINNGDLFIFVTLYFYSIDQIYDNRQYKLYFSFGQTKLLLGLNKDNINLLSLLYKCSLENEEHKGINFNFPLIKTIRSSKKLKYNNYFNQNNTKFNYKKHSKSYKYKYKKGLNIRLNLPYIEIKVIELEDNSKIKKKTFQIKEEILNKILETDFVEILKYIGNFFVNNTNIDIPSINSNLNINLFKSSEKKIIIIQNEGDTLIKRSKTQKDMQVKKPKLKKRNDKGHIISLFKK